jgi:REP element-mobilizing transposase RayT
MRKPRLLEKGAIYHVVARANRDEFILNTPKLKDVLLDIIRKAKKRWRFNITNFCIG